MSDVLRCIREMGVERPETMLRIASMPDAYERPGELCTLMWGLPRRACEPSAKDNKKPPLSGVVKEAARRTGIGSDDLQHE